MNHHIPMNKAVRRKGVTIAAAALSVALVAPFAQSVAYPEISAVARADQEDAALSRELPENPPVFFANPTRTPRTSAQGVYSVRSTPSLVGNFFPEGTTFELQDPTWTFSRATGENHPEYERADTVGWVGFSRNNDGSYGTNPKGSNLQSNAPNNHPIVVPKTGQILFGLGPTAKDGSRIDVPLRAVYQDTKNKRKYVWNFRQGIQIGGLKENERPGKPSDMVDAEFTEFHPVPAKSAEDLQKLKALEESLGLKFEAGIQGYKGWYQPLENQNAGRSAGWNTPKNKPVNNINLAHKENEIFEPKPVNKPVETTAGNIPDPELGIRNKEELPENTQFTWDDESVFDSPSESKKRKA